MNYLGRRPHKKKEVYLCMSKGKQPRTRVNKVPKLLLSERKEVFVLFVQEMGLEAATF